MANGSEVAAANYSDFIAIEMWTAVVLRHTHTLLCEGRGDSMIRNLDSVFN